MDINICPGQDCMAEGVVSLPFTVINSESHNSTSTTPKHLNIWFWRLTLLLSFYSIILLNHFQTFFLNLVNCLPSPAPCVLLFSCLVSLIYMLMLFALTPLYYCPFLIVLICLSMFIFLLILMVISLFWSVPQGLAFAPSLPLILVSLIINS